jgi:hypothetical protein
MITKGLNKVGFSSSPKCSERHENSFNFDCSFATHWFCYWFFFFQQSFNQNQSYFLVPLCLVFSVEKGEFEAFVLNLNFLIFLTLIVFKGTMTCARISRKYIIKNFLKENKTRQKKSKNRVHPLI